jgi:excisionase family DNA binding protein
MSSIIDIHGVIRVIMREERPEGNTAVSRNPQKFDRLTYTVEELGQILGLGRSATYTALRKGVIPTIRIGRRFVIPKPAIEEWLRNRPAVFPIPVPPTLGFGFELGSPGPSTRGGGR